MTLTREYILALNPGIELDALVAEKVMNGERKAIKTFAPKEIEYWEFSESNQPWVDEWKPSTDISAAREVVDKIVERGWMLYKLAHTVSGTGEVDGYVCRFLPRQKPGDEVDAIADTAPEAICKAALLATLEVES